MELLRAGTCLTQEPGTESSSYRNKNIERTNELGFDDIIEAGVGVQDAGNTPAQLLETRRAGQCANENSGVADSFARRDIQKTPDVEIG